MRVGYTLSPGSGPPGKLLLFKCEKGGFGLFLGFFCRAFFFQRQGRFFHGFSAAPFFRHGDSPDNGWVVFISTYLLTTVLLVNVNVITFRCLPINFTWKSAGRKRQDKDAERRQACRNFYSCMNTACAWAG